MRYLHNICVTVCILLLTLSCGGGASVTQLPSLGGKGLSGLYAGTVDGTLFVAGGCNFPDKPLTEGGRKVFYDEILSLDGGEWTKAGTLPKPSAYGAYIQRPEGLMIIGGAGPDGSHSDVWMVTADSVMVLPSLPLPLEQAAWYDDGERIYLAGGLSNGTPSNAVLVYEGGRWSDVSSLPGPVVQGIATLSDGVLGIWGGYDPDAKKALTGGYALDLEAGAWTDLKADVTFVGSASLGGRAVGGCDAGIFTMALNLPADKVLEYQSQDYGYYRFRDELLTFDPSTGGWVRSASSEHLARAGAAVAEFDGGLVSIGGELKPGIRTPEVWMIKTNK